MIDTGDGGLLNLERLGALAADRLRVAGNTASRRDHQGAAAAVPAVGNFLYATVMRCSTRRASAPSTPAAGPSSGTPRRSLPPARAPCRTWPSGPAGAGVRAAGRRGAIGQAVSARPRSRVQVADPHQGRRAEVLGHRGAVGAADVGQGRWCWAAMWNGRVQTIIDKGAPLAIEWNQNMIQVQAYGIPKTARNPAGGAAVRGLCEPGDGAGGYAKTCATARNLKAYGMLPPDLTARHHAGRAKVPRDRVLPGHRLVGGQPRPG